MNRRKRLGDMLIEIGTIINKYQKQNEVNITVSEGSDSLTIYHIHTAREDVGRVIGKNGKIIHAIRTIMRAAASKQGLKIAIEVE